MFLANDTVCIWEQKNRNSGQTEGKFAERGRKKNPATNTWYKPSDFYIGAVLTIQAVPFEILKLV